MARSLQIRRANEAVEKFGIYFWNADSENNLTQLQKIYWMCGIGDRPDLPQTEGDCIEVGF
jgi:hypothetical protein